MSEPIPTPPQEYLLWQQGRLARLTAPDGWLNLTDRLWIELGNSRFGSAPDNDLVLSVGPAHIGTLTQLDNGDVRLERGGEDTLLLKHGDQSPRFMVGDLLCEITVTNGRNALRVRDTALAVADAFPGLHYFPYNPSWRLEAQWVALDAPLELTVGSSQSIPSVVEVRRKAVFERDGQSFELLATHGTAQKPQFVFRDLTAVDQTYPAARFLFGEDLTDTTIVMDFNKAYNPPCSFTVHANCPLPPPQNVLPVAIAAGELKPVGKA
jgi:uncharacterized protein (DUF1684 family)